MPTVSALLSGGVSVGLLAGVVSGLFYLVVAGIRWAGRLREARELVEREQLRRQQLAEAEALVADPASSPDDGALRRRRPPCDDADREVKQQSGEWFYRQVQRRFQPALAVATIAPEDGDEGMEHESARVRDFIERLVEALVAGDLDNVCIKRLHAHPEYERMFACHHEPLCKALARLSFALQMAIAHKHMAEQDSPSAAHAALKLLIQQIIQEAKTLPNFKALSPKGEEDESQVLEDMGSKTYEDILATAILNKVIERYQQDSIEGGAVDGNSNLLSPELMALVANHQRKFISTAEIGISSPSSDDGKISDVDSLSEFSNTDPLTVTIEECIEETTFSNVEEDDIEEAQAFVLDRYTNGRAPFPEYGRDIVDGPTLDNRDDYEEDEDADSLEEDPSLQPTDMINPVDSWEENWLFQKKRLKIGGVPQPMPVPMLVPNPSEDFRALIGDRDAEDVSDLSECSDGALEDLVLAEEDVPVEEPISPVTSVSAKDTREDSLMSEDNDVSSSVESPEIEPHVCVRTSDVQQPVIFLNYSADNEVTYEEAELTEAKNMEFLKASEDCLSEFGQQEGEYTEDYAAVTQRQMDSLTALSEPEISDVPDLPRTPIPQLSSDASEIDESVVAILDGLVPSENLSEENPELAIPPRPGTEPSDDEHSQLPAPGTIAEREHKKWETAPPLPNNPYSTENIYKRLSKRSPYSRLSSSSDTSMEFPELKDPNVGEDNADKSLQVICAPTDVDHKRYGRDYYINAQPADNKKHLRNSDQQEENQNVEHEDTTVDFDEEEEPQHVEKKVAHWQKEINQADQYYNNIRNKTLEATKKTDHKDVSNNVDPQSDPSALIKSIKSSLFEDQEAKKNKVPEKRNSSQSKEFDKQETLEDLRNRRSGLGESELVMTSARNRNNPYENGSDTFSNGYSRSHSPSGSSVLTSDGEYNMPSVRELTKRFTTLRADSDSSPSTSKSVSPAPRWRSQEHLLEPSDMRVKKPEHHLSQSSLSPPRTVREIHSLTARSISKEFREELRHNQPVPLNRNVYKPGNQTNGTNGDLAEETPSPRRSKSPVPARSMQNSIAFWEQLQKHNS